MPPAGLGGSRKIISPLSHIKTCARLSWAALLKRVFAAMSCTVRAAVAHDGS